MQSLILSARAAEQPKTAKRFFQRMNYIILIIIIIRAVKMLKTPPDGLKSRTAGVKFFNRLC
jgi:hypothetical protein